MPIILLTEAERKQLLQLLNMHLDGLRLARDEITLAEVSMESMLELTGTVDEAVTHLEHIAEKVKDAI